MAITQLSPAGIPGKRYSFIAKDAAAVFIGEMEISATGSCMAISATGSEMGITCTGSSMTISATSE